MVRILSIAIDAVSSAVFILPTVFLLQYFLLKQRSFRKIAVTMFFSLYLAALFLITGIPSAYSLRFEPAFNLIPIIDVATSPLDYVRNTMLNILLFVPLGFLLPILWERYRSLKMSAFMGLVVSALIELLQIFTFRLTDVDDLITNTAGTVAGYLGAKWFLERSGTDSLPGRENSREPFAVILLVLCIQFFLEPLLSGAIWESVLNGPLWEKIR